MPCPVILFVEDFIEVVKNWIFNAFTVTLVGLIILLIILAIRDKKK